MNLIYGIIIFSISGSIGYMFHTSKINNLTKKNIKLQDTIERLKYDLSKKDKLLLESGNYEILK